MMIKITTTNTTTTAITIKVVKYVFLTRHGKCNINSDHKIINLHVNQSHYIENMLNKFKHLNIKEDNTSFNSSMKLNDNCDKTIAQLEYASVIGSLMYDKHCTRTYMTLIHASYQDIQAS